MNPQPTSNNFVIFFSIVNFTGILIIFTMMILTYNKVVDNENSIISLNDYRKKNEIQLNNLIRDININDKYLASKME
jgi:Na+-transporting NADH:ubiquinone oxidoreductase subunit NqrF